MIGFRSANGSLFGFISQFAIGARSSPSIWRSSAK
jgi:hypothetical protein